MGKPCKVAWCTTLTSVDTAEYCVVHEKHPELRKDNHDRSIRALRDEQARQRRVTRNAEKVAATERARELNRQRMINRG